MAQLDKKTIENLTKLSRIACSDEEQDAILVDLQKILKYVEQLEEVDTENVPPCNQVLAEMNNVMREDEVGETLPRKDFLKNTKQVGGLVQIPPVINK
jgi:aspartyl-tRNA(Asn)/glutamyl-tRNA(Gln) amidotransferase subunit C